MTVDDKRAFLCALRDLMVRHEIDCIYPTYDGEICVNDSNGRNHFYDLGTISEIEEEIKNLK